MLGEDLRSDESTEGAREVALLESDGVGDAATRAARVRRARGASWGGETRRFFTFWRGRRSSLLRLENASTSRSGVGGRAAGGVVRVVGAPGRGSGGHGTATTRAVMTMALVDIMDACLVKTPREGESG